MLIRGEYYYYLHCFYGSSKRSPDGMKWNPGIVELETEVDVNAYEIIS